MNPYHESRYFSFVLKEQEDKAVDPARYILCIGYASNRLLLFMAAIGLIIEASLTSTAAFIIVLMNTNQNRRGNVSIMMCKKLVLIA